MNYTILAGKAFAMMGSLQGAADLASSAMYQAIYPHTLSSLPGLTFIIAAIVLIPAVIIIL